MSRPRYLGCPCGHLYDDDCARHAINDLLDGADLDAHRHTRFGFDEINYIVRNRLCKGGHDG